MAKIIKGRDRNIEIEMKDMKIKRKGKKLMEDFVMAYLFEAQWEEEEGAELKLEN